MGTGTEHVRWARRPDLRSPVVLTAFAGWNDAGDAATTAANHVAGLWDLDRVGHLDPEEFYDFTQIRPDVTLDDDGGRLIEWPEVEIRAGELPGTNRDVVVLVGPEPSLRWRTFTTQITRVARELGAEMVVTLGALLTDIPHTRPTSIIGTALDEEIVERLDLRRSTYEGPTGIVGVLQAACHDAALPAVSLWASVPSYVPGSSSPKAALALVERLAALLAVPIPVTDLEIASADYERQINDLVEGDEESSTFVAELEAAYDDANFELDPDDTDLVAEVERFLRDN